VHPPLPPEPPDKPISTNLIYNTHDNTDNNDNNEKKEKIMSQKTKKENNEKNTKKEIIEKEKKKEKNCDDLLTDSPKRNHIDMSQTKKNNNEKGEKKQSDSNPISTADKVSPEGDNDPLAVICKVALDQQTELYSLQQTNTPTMKTIVIAPYEPGSRRIDKHPGNYCRPMVVEASVNEHPITLTVDTGSFLSVISESTLEQIPGNIPRRHDDPLLERRLRGIQSTVQPTGIVTLSLELPTRLPTTTIKIPVDFVVIPNHHSVVILGMDYLELLGARVDIPMRCLTFKKAHRNHVPLHFKLSTERTEGETTAEGEAMDEKAAVYAIPETYGVVVTTTATRIRPFHTAFVPVSASECAENIGFLAANDYKNHCSHYIGLVSATLIQPNRPDNFVSIANPTEEVIWVPANFQLGMLQPLIDKSDGKVMNLHAHAEDEPDHNVPPEFIKIFKEQIRPTLNHLDSEQIAAVRNLLYKHHSIFHFGNKPFGKSKTAECVFRLVDGWTPVNNPPRRMNPLDQKDLKQELDRFEKQGLIEPSNSPWAAPVMIVRKDNKIRVVVDFRGLNRMVVADQYPIPRVDDLFNALGGKSWFSTLDIMKSFFQIPINDERSRELTAFRTPFGLYQWKRMPQGYKNSPAIFQRAMDSILGTAKWEFVLCYIDDLIIFSENFNDHVNHVDVTMRMLSAAGLTIQAEKAKLFRRSIEFVGYEVSGNGRTLTQAKTEAITSIPTPKTAADAVHFTALCSFYRSLIKDFASIAAPLDRFRKESYREKTFKRIGKKSTRQVPQVFDWTPEDQQAFETLKKRLIDKPVIVSFNPSAKHRLLTDASHIGIGGILEQLEPDGLWHPVIYLSRKLSKSESNYSATEIELLALHYSLGKLEYFLLGKDFEVLTDHRALLWLKALKTTNRRLIRWSMDLTPFDDFMAIKHRPGKLMGAADALSRLPSPALCLGMLTRSKRKRMENPSTDVTEEQVEVTEKRARNDEDPQPANEQNSQAPDDTDSTDNEADDAAEDRRYTEFLAQLPGLYLKDEFFGLIARDLKDDRPAVERPRSHPHFNIDDTGLIWHSDLSPDSAPRLCIPTNAKDFKLYILFNCHDRPFAGHVGAEKTQAKIRSRYFWKGLARDVKEYCSQCVICQQVKARTDVQRAPLRQIPVPYERMHTISMDFMFGLPKTANGNSGILVIVDSLSKYGIFEPVPDTLTSEAFANLFHRSFFKRFGMPEKVISDRDKLFTAGFWTQLAAACGVKHIFATRHHPQSNGQTERLNRTLKQMLRAFADYQQTNWEPMLPNLEFAYNDSIHSATSKTPFELLYGMHPRAPNLPTANGPPGPADSFHQKMTDVVQLAKDMILISRYQTELYYNNRYSIATNQPFQVGDLVWIKTDHFIPENRRQQLSKKLIPEYVGPYPISKILNYHAVEVQFPASVRISNKINRSHLKKYREPTWRKQSPKPSPEVIDGELEYEVDQILDERVWRKRPQFLVRWKGNDAAADTWEPAENLRNAPLAVEAFRSKRKSP
jgi:hypothetical protein